MKLINKNLFSRIVTNVTINQTVNKGEDENQPEVKLILENQTYYLSI